MKQPKFGKLPTGNRFQELQKASNFKDGKFQNINHTPDLAEGVTYYQVLKEFIFERSKDTKPKSKIPSPQHNLKNLDTNKDVIIWFGHSSYFMQIDGKKMLVDPVLSGAASPIKYTTKSFDGSDVYTVDDLPEIDILFITHDHWDHLDYKTIKLLQSKVKQVICPLGVAEHLEHWGYPTTKIIEKNWNDTIDLQDGFIVTLTPARHFSGRGFKRQPTLWTSYILQTPNSKIFLGGDSGYDTHFAEIGTNHGPFDVAILECGQYNKNWKYIHMMPEETVQASIDLKAEKLMPVHWSKFVLAQHAWDDSIRRVIADAKQKNVPVLHPMIGEKVYIKEWQTYTPWWENVN